MARRGHGSSRSHPMPLASATLPHPCVLIIPHARLMLWIPRESLDIAKHEVRLHGSRLPVELHPLAPAAGSEWQAIELIGEANAILDTAQRIERVVEETDDCVLAINVVKASQGPSLFFSYNHASIHFFVHDCRTELPCLWLLTMLCSSVSALHQVLVFMSRLKTMRTIR